MTEQERCPECGRRKAHGGDDWSVSYNAARWDEVADLCGRHLPSYWSDESIPDCKDATLAHQKEQLSALRKAIAAAKNLLAVLHRDGGHHTERVGFEQSCSDAEKSFPCVLAALAAAEKMRRDAASPRNRAAMAAIEAFDAAMAEAEVRKVER